ncbi:DUF927 domain-containing protein [Mesorhizobium sp. YR577]|uniref:DUF927 domain-containing protein n=1 Tax=Mesorhizobium sp. YR577 TaxID=1884373 RepID=UPI0008F1446D|nr:DUF927 domain-containing protein [Mesorhizobium sp. YR577]SFU09533.1 Uncharcterized protein, DUF927 family [Mesorhizobium sp. YR577]
MKRPLPNSMFAPLTEAERLHQGTGAKAAKPTLKPIVPAPPAAINTPFPRHREYGRPSVVYTYRNGDGQVCFHALRFERLDADGTKVKVVLPLTWCEDDKGRATWRFKGPGNNRPLFNSNQIAQLPARTVIVCEGEKAAAAATALFPDWVATTTLGGSKSAHNSDFSLLAGRRVVISPDFDEPGLAYGQDIARLALAAGASEVLHLSATLLSSREGNTEGGTAGPPPKSGWDLADAIEEGWTAEMAQKMISTQSALPVFPVAANDNAGEGDQRRGPPQEFVVGPEWTFRRVNADGEVQMVPFCSPLRVRGWARDEHGQQWSLLVALVDRDGIEHECFVSNSQLGDDGATVRKMLMERGLRLTTLKSSRTHLNHYLMSADPAERYRTVASLGWFNDVFVLPDEVIGPTSETVLYRPAGMNKSFFGANGTIKDWKELARFAEGNSRLILALSVAFAGPLLRHTGDETGGFHFRGKSSTGKSTTMVLASTVWGGPHGNYVVQWRATDNGLEGIASGHSDMLLCLDELSQASGRTLGETMYMLGNGMGKVRADQSGSARPTKSWRLMFLSTGEESFEDKMREAGPNQRIKAGQEVRVIDILADAGKGLGIFDTLNGRVDGSDLSRHIKDLASKSYGVAGSEFLKAIIDDIDDARGYVQGIQKMFVERALPAGADGQVARVAQRFGLVAGAGELAIRHGILPLTMSSAIWSCEVCFEEWLRARGSVGASEDRRSVESVLGFITRHGATRFDWWDEGEQGASSESARDRLGWKKREGGQWSYYLTPDGFKEACTGFDGSMVAKVLAAKEILKLAGDGKSSKAVKVPGHPKMRLYHLVPPSENEDDG